MNINSVYNELNTISNLSYKSDVSTSSDVFFRTESESTFLLISTEMTLRGEESDSLSVLKKTSDDVETSAL